MDFDRSENPLEPLPNVPLLPFYDVLKHSRHVSVRDYMKDLKSTRDMEECMEIDDPLQVVNEFPQTIAGVTVPFLPQTLDRYEDLKRMCYRGDSSWAKIIIHLDLIAGQFGLQVAGLYPLSNLGASQIVHTADSGSSTSAIRSTPEKPERLTSPEKLKLTSPGEPSSSKSMKKAASKAANSCPAEDSDDEEKMPPPRKKSRIHRKDFEDLSAEEDNKFDDSSPLKSLDEEILEKSARDIGHGEDSGEESAKSPVSSDAEGDSSDEGSDKSDGDKSSEEVDEKPPMKRGPGRPRKNPLPKTKNSKAEKK